MLVYRLPEGISDNRDPQKKMPCRALAVTSWVPGDDAKQQRPGEHLDFGSEEADSEAIHKKSNHEI